MTITIDTIEFKSPEKQDTLTYDYKQQVKRAYSGNIYAFNLPVMKILKLSFKEFPVRTFHILKDILDDAEEHDYVDYFGNEYVVRCLDREIIMKVASLGNDTATYCETANVLGEYCSFELNLEVIG